MSRPKVSVIVPVYNTEKFLENCISSIKKQTLSLSATFEAFERVCLSSVFSFFLGLSGVCAQPKDTFVSRGFRVRGHRRCSDQSA